MLNVPLRVEEPVHFGRGGRGGRKALETGKAAELPPAGRVPRVSRLMALAIKVEMLIRDGMVKDYADVARLGGVSRARVSQIANLLLLAPDLQAQLLFLPPVAKGRDPVTLRDLQPIALTWDWKKQRKRWAALGL
jgi:hypothetical protein